MKVSADRATLEGFVKLICRGKRRYIKHLKVWACQARIFVATNGLVAGTEAIVLREGGCVVSCRRFLGALDYYRLKGKPSVIIEVVKPYLKVGNLRMRYMEYSDQVMAPADFQVFPVTNTWIADTAGKSSPVRTPPSAR